MERNTGLIEVSKRKKSDCRQVIEEKIIDRGENFIWLQTKLTSDLIYGKPDWNFRTHEVDYIHIRGKDAEGRVVLMEIFPEVRSFKPLLRLYDTKQLPSSIWVRGLFSLSPTGYYYQSRHWRNAKLYLDQKPVCKENPKRKAKAHWIWFNEE